MHNAEAVSAFNDTDEHPWRRQDEASLEYPVNTRQGHVAAQRDKHDAYCMRRITKLQKAGRAFLLRSGRGIRADRGRDGPSALSRRARSALARWALDGT
jgi:hypothetical protein